MKRSVIAGICGLTVLALPIAGATLTNALTLAESIRLALENNPELRASVARVEAAAGRAVQAGKWSNPALELSAEEWPLESGRGFSDAKQTLGIAQTLPFPGKKSLDRQIGGTGVKLSEAELALRRTELVRDVKAAFFRVLASEQSVAVAGELVQVAESAASTAAKKVEAGATAYQEQLRAEIQLEQARTTFRGFQLDRTTARQVFATLLGQPGLNDAPLAGDLTHAPDTVLPEAGATNALERHPSLGIAQANVQRAELERRRARLEPYPDVTAGLAGGRLGETDESIIELRFSVPLPILDTGKGARREAQANLTAAEADLHVVRLQLEREWAQALERCRAAAEQAATYRDRIVPKATEALRLVQTGFEEGKFNFIDLLDTQRTTAEVRLAYQQKLLELHIAHAELEALLRPQTTTPLSTH